MRTRMIPTTRQADVRRIRHAVVEELDPAQCEPGVLGLTRRTDQPDP